MFTNGIYGTSPEVKCLHRASSRREMCTSNVSNGIYDKFAHGAAFYTLNGQNVNVMLEFSLTWNANLKLTGVASPGSLHIYHMSD